MSRRIMLSPGDLGFDTSAPIGADVAKQIVRTSRSIGAPLTFAIRYVSLGQPQPRDITADELGALHAAGLAVVLVQHVRATGGRGWTPSGSLGQLDAAAAIRHAISVGYATGCSLAMDLEDVRPGTSSADVAAHCACWALAVKKAGYSPVLYVGFSTVLDAAQLGALPFDAFWSDYGQRTITGTVFAMKQHPQTTLEHFGFIDPDEILTGGIFAHAPDADDIDTHPNLGANS